MKLYYFSVFLLFSLLGSHTVAAETNVAQAALTDQIYDPQNEANVLLQQPDAAAADFPRDASGRVDWAQTLNNGLIAPRAALTEQGEMLILEQDTIMKNTQKMPYVTFPHKAHTQWLNCSACHPALFPEKSGGSKPGASVAYCGVCHGNIAFSTVQCARCHNLPHSDSIEQTDKKLSPFYHAQTALMQSGD